MKSKWNCELNLDQLLADPLVHTLMAADRIDPRDLHEELRQKARDLPQAEKASRRKGFSMFAECCC